MQALHVLARLIQQVSFRCRSRGDMSLRAPARTVHWDQEMRAQLTSAPATRRTPGATAALTLAAIVLLVAASATRAGTISASGSGASALTPTAPWRLLDTREQIDGARPLGAGESVMVQVAGRCGVEPGSTAVAVTITTTATIGAGFVTAWASGTVRPLASSLNWARTGEVRANGALVPLGANGAIELYAHGSAHLVVDVTAFFAPADTATSGRFLPLPCLLYTSDAADDLYTV